MSELIRRREMGGKEALGTKIPQRKCREKEKKKRLKLWPPDRAQRSGGASGTGEKGCEGLACLIVLTVCGCGGSSSRLVCIERKKTGRGWTHCDGVAQPSWR